MDRNVCRRVSWPGDLSLDWWFPNKLYHLYYTLYWGVRACRKTSSFCLQPAVERHGRLLANVSSDHGMTSQLRCVHPFWYPVQSKDVDRYSSRTGLYQWQSESSYCGRIRRWRASLSSYLVGN